jgi:hypothetical protein
VTRAGAYAAVMRKLDKSHCGAFIAAPVLAREVLLMSSETGETASVPDAVTVALVHAKKPGSGRGAAAVANYAEGLSATLDGKFELATAPLDAALEQARKSGWLDLATHAGTELAAAWVRLGDDDQANSALARVAGLCDADTPSGVLRRWRDCMTTRLSEASAAVRAPAENEPRASPQDSWTPRTHQREASSTVCLGRWPRTSR